MSRYRKHTLSCECGYSNTTFDKPSAERYARRHEGREGHIGMTTVEPTGSN